ncbi:hypothetical protein G7051_05380 [Dysgonomonas sp. HDW5B]|uniref:hypothetical protein n=1 Tax=Dysgonomonas sp. HDW5B TaxID=2714927 RepID=UPI00140B7F70|nr:hypothetical protein [Dysgonomonas sp. HDW5B]QIK53802.1 hypothetical protein G7051_05380 [Dysgonomonas sp. HDW5B]
MSTNTVKSNASSVICSCSVASIPVAASQCIGLSFGEILKIHKTYHILKPVKKNSDLIVEIRFSEATLSCLIRDDVCIDAFFQTDDIDQL